MAHLRQRTNSEQRIAGRGKTYVWEIEYSQNQYERKSFSLGRLTDRQAHDVFKHFDELLRAKKVNQMPAIETNAWLEGISDRLFRRLTELGLIIHPVRRNAIESEHLIGQFTRRYIDQMESAADRTKNNYEQTRSWLLKHFDEERPLITITPQDMKRWQETLKASASLKSIPNRNKHVQRAKTFFRAAVNDRILQQSPAAILRQEKLPGGRRIDRAREFFVDATLTAKVLDGLESNRWRLIFALLRYQGLRRCEVFALNWNHINWKAKRIAIHSPKTGYRECPLFPEVLPYLDEEWGLAIDRADRAGVSRDDCGPVVRWSGTKESLTGLMVTRVGQILGKEAVWPKILQQLRSTRRTELDEIFPMHVVCEWLGHDDETARRHYQQVTPDHWEKAVRVAETADESTRKSSVPGPKYPQNTRSQEDSPVIPDCQNDEKTLGNVAFPRVCGDGPIPRRGVISDGQDQQECDISGLNANEQSRDFSAVSSCQQLATIQVLLVDSRGDVQKILSENCDLADAFKLAADWMAAGTDPTLFPVVTIERIAEAGSQGNR